MEAVKVPSGVTSFHSPLWFSGSMQINPSKRFVLIKPKSDYSFGFASRSVSIGFSLSPLGSKSTRAILSPSSSDQASSEAIANSTSHSSSDCRSSEVDSQKESRHETGKESGATAAALEGGCEPPPGEKKEAANVRRKKSRRRFNEKVIAEVNEQLSQGLLPPYFVYLMDLGMDVDQIKKMTKWYPLVARMSVERRLKPFVEFLVDIGVSRSDVPSVLTRAPSLFSFKIEENLIPTMAYLESLGFDKSRWVVVVRRFPMILAFGRKKLVALADYFCELGLPAESLGKLLMKTPVLSALSLDSKIKPTTEFLLDKGFTKEEIARMVLRFSGFYGLSLAENLMPKLDFFFQMGYAKSDLVDFPQFFGYSLEGRIKPRYHLARKHGVRFKLQLLLPCKDEHFEIHLKKKIEKLC